MQIDMRYEQHDIGHRRYRQKHSPSANQVDFNLMSAKTMLVASACI